MNHLIEGYLRINIIANYYFLKCQLFYIHSGTDGTAIALILSSSSFFSSVKKNNIMTYTQGTFHK